MNTKIVYVLVSNDSDIYYEQTLLSAFTLKHYNKGAIVYLVVDNDTAKTLSGVRGEILQYIDHVIDVCTPLELNSMQRSRFLKTKLRSIVDGDFFYLDGDTIVCGSLEGLDHIQASLAAVPDSHVKASDSPWHESQNELVNKLFGINISPDSFYYNGGAIFCKECKTSRLFYEQWHKYWYTSKDKGCSLDQPAFFYTNQKMGNCFDRLNDIYNCQISCCFTYFHTSLIIHYWGTSVNESNTFIWARKSFYQRIKKEQQLSEAVKEIALTCKSTIPSPSILLTNKNHYDFFNSEFGVRILKEYEKDSVFLKIMQSTLRFYQKAVTFIAQHQS